MMPPGGVRRIDRKLIHRSAWNRNSRKFTCKILHIRSPIPPDLPVEAPHYGLSRYRL
jgi:hypothetical protein